MKRLRLLAARVREFFAPGRVDRDLTEEVESHFEFLVDEHLREGMTADAARATARRDLGGLDQTKEQVRDECGFPQLESVLREFRYAVRLLRKSPGFSTVAVLTLALGIGVNAAIFSVVDTVVLRPLLYSEAGRLVSIWETMVDRQNVATGTGALSGRPVPVRNRIVVAPANLADYRARASSFSGLAAYAPADRSLTGSGTPERLIGEEVTFNYFDVLGERPALGRGLLPSDDSDGAPRVVVISQGLWQQRFGGDRSLVGRTVTLDGQPCEVVGIMPEGFRSVTAFGATEPVSFWAPAAYPPELLASHGDHEVRVVARLKPGVSVSAARADMATVSEALASERPADFGDVRTDLAPLGDDVVREVRRSLLVLLGAVGLILLMACVNVANLLIVRAVGRRREIAVRFALGASRGRVMLQFFVQSVVLAALGCAAGLVLARWTKGLLVAVAPATIPRLDMVSVDARILAITVAVSVATSLLFGMLPAWQVRRARPIEAMTGERAPAGGAVLRWRSALMLAEVALSTVLLIGAGLMSRSLLTLNAVELGFRTDRVLALNIALPAPRYRTGDDRLAFFEAVERAVAVLPGVRSVGFANRLPMRGGWESGLMLETPTAAMPPEPNTTAPERGEAPRRQFENAGFQAVNPGYFTALGIPLRRGRLLEIGDRKDTLPVAVVSEQFTRRFFPGSDAIGRRFRRGPGMPWVTIVGVVGDVRRDGKAAEIAPQVFLAAAQTLLYPTRLSDLAVRADVDPISLAPAIRAAVWSVDKEQPVTAVRTLDEVLALRTADRRFQTLLFALFAVLALALAVVGIYGVVAYAVSERFAEIGVRMALGANRSTILRWVVGSAARLVVAGACIGLGGAWGLSRTLRGLLFEIPPTDPATYAVATAALVAVGLGASLAAAHRATKVDPLVALRYQ